MSGGPREIDRAILDAVRGVRYGSVEVVVHEGRVVQIEIKKKVRVLEDAGSDRNTGGPRGSQPYPTTGTPEDGR